jgi:hypothetical protein
MFDDRTIDSWGSSVPDFVVSMFQEADRFEEEREDGLTVQYRARRETVLQRLDLLGLTDEFAALEYEQWREGFLEIDDKFETFFEDLDLNALDYAEWKRRLPEWLAEERPHTWTDLMLSMATSSDIRLAYRAALEACPDVEFVTLDVTELVEGFEYNCDELCDHARSVAARERPELEPVVIIGEGVSDRKILEYSLGHLFPDFQDYFSFFDHEALRVEGGVSSMVKVLKAFAAARISTQILAVFDNDAAGEAGLRAATELDLPDNFMLLRMPDIAIAESYPTVGPQGEHLSNINGRACSIELYLGLEALAESNGSLAPVRWGGYVAKADRYQGEIVDKARVVAAFFDRIERLAPGNEAREAFPELVELWKAIFELQKRRYVA